MTGRFRKAGPLRRHYIAQWRRYRGLSQDEVAAAMGISKPSFSKIESGVRQYSQNFLEACADALDCQPADLLSRLPQDVGLIWSLWEAIPADRRHQAAEILRTFAEEEIDESGLRRAAERETPPFAGPTAPAARRAKRRPQLIPTSAKKHAAPPE